MVTFLRNLFYLFFLIAPLIYGQSGNPFITNFEPEIIVDNGIYCIEHNENNIMFFGTAQGVLMFNAEKWELIETPNTVISLKYIAQNNKLMVGLNSGAGFISKNQQGIYRFNTFINGKDIRGSYHQILELENTIAFQSANSLLFVSANGEKILNNWIPSGETEIVSSFKINNTLYASTIKAQLLAFKELKTDTIDLSSIVNNEKIVFTTAFNDERILVGLSNGHLYTFDGKEFQRFNYEETEYTKASVLNGGLVIEQFNKVVLSTLAGGIILIDLANGKTSHIINFQSGLPDDEILSIGTDFTHGIWASHLYGVSRIDLNFPVESYHSFPGLKGNVFSLYKNDTTLFVGTNEGLFYYAREEQYNTREKVKYVNIRVAVNSDNNDQPGENKNPSAGSEKNNTLKTEEQPTEGKKGFISRLFRKNTQKDDEENEEEKPEEKGILNRIFVKEKPENKKITDPEEKSYIYQKKKVKEKIYMLQSVSYQYKKIEGFDEKIKEIIPLENHLILLTNLGLFQFYNGKISSLVDDVYTSAYYSNKKDSVCYVETSKGLYILKPGKKDIVVELAPFGPINIQGMSMDKDKNLFIGGNGLLYKVKTNNEPLTLSTFMIEIYGPVVPVQSWRSEPYIYNKGMLYTLKNGNPEIVKFFEKEISHGSSIFKDIGNNVWVNNADKWKLIGGDSILSGQQIERYFTVFDDISVLYVDQDRNIWVVDDFQKIYKLKTAELTNYKNDIDLIIHSIENYKKGLLLPPDDVELSYNENAVQVNISAPFFIKHNATQYSYYIDGLYDNWSSWTTAATIPQLILPPGKYTLKLKARNIFGFESDVESISIRILPPYWKRGWFYGVIILFVFFLLFMYIKYRERKLRKERQVLEEKVKERTTEIENQKNKLENQAIAITDSINYAQKIQEAMLPSHEVLKKNLSDHFILFMPRDIVSGDFYWAFEDKNELFLAAADCTGHGVPGAFMSMLGITFLNELVKKQNLRDPADILNNTRSMIIESLRNEDIYKEANDGMDIAFCNIRLKEKEIWYAGAYNPLVIVKNKGDESLNNLKYRRERAIENENKILVSIDAERMPVGNSPLNKQKFISHKIPVKKGDVFYIFSDGYADQLRADRAKKYLQKNFKKKLLSISHLPMTEQRTMLIKEFHDWKGKQGQVDDVLVIGFKIN